MIGLLAFVSAFVASVGASLLISGLMDGSTTKAVIGGAILAIQALVLWVWWVTA